MRATCERGGRVTRTKTTKLGVVVLMATMAMGACGGAGAFRQPVGQFEPPGTDLPVVIAGTSSAVPPLATQPGNAVAFCRDVQDFLALLPTLLQPSAGPAAFSGTSSVLARLQRDAPADIAADVKEMANIERRILNDLAARPIRAADVAQAVEDPSYQAAVQQIGAYAFDRCGGGG